MIIENIDGNSKQSTVYSWKSASVTETGTAAGTNITTVTGFTTLFAPFTDTPTTGVTRKRVPTKIKVTASAATYIKINGGDVITLDGTTPFEAEDLAINSIGISTDGGASTVTVYLQ
jgi:hypothetical protein